ncbi:alpha/beta hydrolase [Desulforhopalus singaporensis]|uniref:Phospholipase/carboxylesterase n=1 Tax=Desulforhopalus singaporensis TaxID=91360 RepID=A0A1H0LYW7_9BACT|nr:alpha/beta hydrolase [Desulforhopalus singaporensis]SDO73283.1 phospholipase/carboxylesterase [Desulforhopalus singaporensis]
MAFLPAVETTTTTEPDSAVIWLHGLGADGNDFAPIVPELRLPSGLGVRFIFPHAPSIPVTINGGFVMPAWYDIVEMDIDRKIDLDGLLASAALVRAFVDREQDRGIDTRRIIVAGFSQGGAVAYQVALSYPKPLGGLLAMSTYFATGSTVTPTSCNQDIPVMVHHGSYDSVVPEQLGQQAASSLKSRGYTVHYRTYPMEHGVCPEQIGDISHWLQQLLNN